MFRNKTVKRMVIGGTAALALAAGLAMTSALLPAIASAQAGMGFQGRQGMHAGWQGDDNRGSFLAEALGISVEEIEAAVESARQAGLDEAVAAGTITQEEADRMADRQGFGRRGHKGGGAAFGHGQVEGKALLAEALGISVEELDTAMSSAHEAALSEAVETGRISQEQAELMAAHQALRTYIDKDEIMAAVLGLSVEELDAARDAGKSHRDLIEESGLDRAALKDAMVSAHQAAVEKALAEGVISPEQAELLENNQGAGLRGHGGHGDHGDHRGRGGRGGRGFHGPSSDQQPPAQDGSSNFRGGNRFTPEGTL